MAQTNQIKKGMFILHNGEPYNIVSAEFYSPGKGAAFTRVKMKNLNTGKVIPFTFKSGEKVEEMEVSFKNMQYLYTDDDSIYFMDPDTYEQLALPRQNAENYLPFMKEGQDYTVIIYQDKIIYLKFPPRVTLKVTETTDAVKGNTATGATKEAVVETGAKVQVPLFIKIGDVIKIDPETGEYQGRTT